jgi:hypothetical protein
MGLRRGKSQDMKCNICGSIMVGRKATMDHPYRYEMSGLDNLFLAGIEVRGCPKCRIEVPAIRAIAELHRAITKDLVFKKAPLTGKEIRFCARPRESRPIDLPLCSKWIQPILSRIENGKVESIGGAMEKLARAIAWAANGKEDVRRVLMESADEKLEAKNRAENRAALPVQSKTRSSLGETSSVRDLCDQRGNLKVHGRGLQGPPHQEQSEAASGQRPLDCSRAHQLEERFSRRVSAARYQERLSDRTRRWQAELRFAEQWIDDGKPRVR